MSDGMNRWGRATLCMIGLMAVTSCGVSQGALVGVEGAAPIVVPATTSTTSSTLVPVATTAPTSTTSATTSTTSTTPVPSTTTMTTVAAPEPPVDKSEVLQTACSGIVNQSINDASIAYFFAIAEFPGVDFDEVESEILSLCPEAVRFFDAIGLQNITNRVSETGLDVELPSCEVSGLEVLVSNPTDVAVGFAFTGRLLDDDDIVLGLSSSPSVVWELDPGESQLIKITFDEGAIQNAGTASKCNVSGTSWIVADGEMADIDALNTTPVEGASDEPSTWLPDLITRAEQAVGSADLSQIDHIYDLRSLHYDNLRDDILGGDAHPAPTEVRVCADSVERFGDRHMSAIYKVIEVGGAELALSGVFRRTANGTWLLLGQSMAVSQNAYSSC